MIERLTYGDVAKKHHLILKDPRGKPYHEECLTREGFDGPYTIMYHQHRPHTAHLSKAPYGFALPSASGDRSLARRHYKTQDFLKRGGSPLVSRTPVLFNDDIVIGVLQPTASDVVYFANSDADDLFYIHIGSGVLKSSLGEVRFEAGDYLYIPKGLIHRFALDPAAEQYWLSLECLGGMAIPQSFRNAVGQLRMDAPYCHRDFKRPVFKGPEDESIRDVVVKRIGAFHGYRYDHSPLDVVGWDGSVYPWAFPINLFQPRVGLTHLPPTVHGTFNARGALICSFVPRPVDFHPDAIPCPYPHSSVDVDEVIFYCRGNFTSRKGVGPGSLSHHPAGIPHGPHPGSYEASIGTRETTELAVMLDCTKPLRATTQAMTIEDAAYHASFA